MLALRDFAPGEELFRVPLRLAITDHIVNNSGSSGGNSSRAANSSSVGSTSTSTSSSSSYDDEDHGGGGGGGSGEAGEAEAEAERKSSHRDEPSAWGARLASRLLREKARGRASPWAPWLSVLPTTTTTARVKKQPTTLSTSDSASAETVVVVRPGSLRSAWAGALPREVAALLPCPAASKALLAATTAADAEFARLPKSARASAAGAAAAAAAAGSTTSGGAAPSPFGADDEMEPSAAMAAYRWARAIVQSRTFGSTAKGEEKKSGGGEGGEGSGSNGDGTGAALPASSSSSSPLPSVSLVRMLVPLADFVNHAGDETEGALSGRAAPTANAEWEVVAEYAEYSSGDEDEERGERRRAAAGGARGRGGRGRPGRGGGFDGVASGGASSSSSSSPPTSWSLVVRATRPLVAGEEVSFSYGSRPNADFLVSYGFVPPRNPHDAVCLFESAEEAAVWAARRLGLLPATAKSDEIGSLSPSPCPILSAAVAAADAETPPSLARAIASSRDPETVAEARRLWLWAGARVDERLAAALEAVIQQLLFRSNQSSSSSSAATTNLTAGELVAARAAELLARSGAPPLSDALGELERAGEHEHEEQHYFRALKRRYAAKEAAVRRSAARASEGAAFAAAAVAAALADAIAPTAAPAAPLPPTPPRGGSARSAWRGVRLMALRAGVYSTMILWDALEAADKAAAAAAALAAKKEANEAG